MLTKKLAAKGAILIEGPKWCGKTTTAEQQAKSILYMDDPSSLSTNLQMADIAPSMLLGGDRLVNEGAENLLTLAGKINTDEMNEPSFMMVLTGTGDFAYRRKDGVYVVPIGCLKD